MADKNQQTLDEIRAVEARINTMFANIGRQVPKQLLDNKSIEDANKSLELAEGYLSKIDYSATSVYNNFRAITSELKSSNFNLNQATKSLRAQEDISQKLMFNEKGITELSLSQLKALKRKQGIQSEIFKLEADAVASSKLNQEEIKNLADLEKEYADEREKRANDLASDDKETRLKAERDLNGINDRILQQIENNENLSEKEKSILKIRYDQTKPIEEVSAALERQLKFEKEIVSSIGLTGAAFDNLNKIGVRAFGGLGINLGTLQEGFESANQAMRAQAIDDMNKGLSTFEKRINTLTAGAAALGPILVDVFTDPLILTKALTDAFFDIDKAATSLANTTGQSFKDIISLSSGTFNNFATAVDLAGVITEETKQSGLNANNIFSPQVLAGAAEFKNLVGGSAEEVAGLLSLTAATGMSTDLIQESIVDTTSAFNGANRAAISQRTVLNDVLTSSTSIQASLAGNPKALADAASAARRLGLSLSEVDQIANSLLDFESSINNELEAQLLTGRSLNLAKARELALNNDLEGLGKEIFDNQVSLTEYSQMNRIQQEGLAKALGVNRDQLAKMAFQQAKLNGLTDDAAAAAAGVELSDLQRMEAIDAIQKSLTSLIQVFAPVLDFFAFILGSIAKFPSLVKVLLLTGIALKTWGNPLTAAAKGIGGVLNSFNSLRSNVKTSGGLLTYLQDGAKTAKDFGKKLLTLALSLIHI